LEVKHLKDKFTEMIVLILIKKAVSLIVNVFLLEILHSFVLEDWQILKS